MSIFSRKKRLSAYIPRGDFEVAIYGEPYAQRQLSAALNAEWFTLTPRNAYQKKKDWPKEGCVNLNIYGSKTTEQDNWLGYILPSAQNINPAIAQMASDMNLAVHGKIERLGDYWKLMLHLPWQYQARLQVKLHRDEADLINIQSLIKKGQKSFYGNLIAETIPSGKYKGQSRYYVVVNGLVVGHSRPDFTPILNAYLGASFGTIVERINAEVVLRIGDDGYMKNGWSTAYIVQGSPLPYELR
jgi:hypothetical protein